MQTVIYQLILKRSTTARFDVSSRWKKRLAPNRMDSASMRPTNSHKCPLGHTEGGILVSRTRRDCGFDRRELGDVTCLGLFTLHRQPSIVDESRRESFQWSHGRKRKLTVEKEEDQNLVPNIAVHHPSIEPSISAISRLPEIGRTLRQSRQPRSLSAAVASMRWSGPSC